MFQAFGHPVEKRQCTPGSMASDLPTAWHRGRVVAEERRGFLSTDDSCGFLPKHMHESGENLS